MKPITPSEIPTEKIKQLPDHVIDTWNQLIVRKYQAGRSLIKQDEIVRALMHSGQVSVDIVYQEYWLDIEDLFRQAGWEVVYDKPGYNETGQAYFIFRPKASK